MVHKPRFDSVNPPLSEAPQRAAARASGTLPAFEIAEVPFVEINGRKALTDEQLADEPGLADFVARFHGAFERDDARYCYYFIPREGVEEEAS